MISNEYVKAGQESKMCTDNDHILLLFRICKSIHDFFNVQEAITNPSF